MQNKKFNPSHLDKLNSPARFEDIPPEFLWNKLSLKEPEVLVDLGAGTGMFSRQFAKRMKSGVIYALDISETMLNWMKDNLSSTHKESNSNAEEYENTAEIIPMLTGESIMPLDNNIADLVFMINLHHEFENAYAVLRESRRVLKTGGKILIVDWRKNDQPGGPPQEIRLEPESVRSQLKKAGFINIEIFSELKRHFMIIAEHQEENDTE